MALTHHLIIRLAAVERGLFKFQDYCVLGDDVVIANKTVGEKYLQIMSGLGVGIRLQKSVVPTPGHSGAEFASRLIINEIDISPLPLGLLFQRDLSRYTMLLKRVYSIFYRLSHLGEF
jgi:hypothetical protein